MNHQPSVELHIEELMLHGVAPADRYRIGDAIENELTSLFAAHRILDLLAKSVEVDRVDVGGFQVERDSKSEGIGRQVARNVYIGLNKYIGLDK
jgi:hypothetical protein